MSTDVQGPDTVRRAGRGGYGKRFQVAEAIEAAIHRGELQPGEKLEGENALAQRFSVSRGTVRQALESLKDRNLITTVGGAGSFVTFDGVPLDQSLGWARALQLAGGVVRTTVLDITRVRWAEVPGLSSDDAATAGTDSAIRIRRLRTVAEGVPVSYEVSAIPATGGLRDVPRTGLVDDSIWATLSREGLRAVRGVQEVGVSLLDDESAAVLHREVGAPYLRTDRRSFSGKGQLVEFVTAILDPGHFRLSVAFGEPA